MARNTVTISLRLEPEEAAVWRERAFASGEQTLTNWIRKRCNIDGAEPRRAGLGAVDPVGLGGSAGETLVSNSAEMPTAPTKMEESVEDHRDLDVSRGGEVPTPKRREPVPVEASGGPCDHDFGYGVGKCPYGTCRNRNKKAKVRCEHGTEKGFRCWQCGGLANV
jgi:hypothetical protein